jgi:SH3-like domain-containing protein
MTATSRPVSRFAPLTLAMVFVATLLCAAVSPGKAEETKLPLPRFVSLDANDVNMRAGPGTEYPILWQYHRKGLPVEIVQEFDTWRRIRDRDGAIGWVQANLLSSRRTAQVVDSQKILMSEPSGGVPIAKLDPGVIGHLKECDGSECRLDVNGYKGWLPRSDLWGVYPDEKVEAK